MSPFTHCPGLVMAICDLSFIAVCVIMPLIYNTSKTRKNKCYKSNVLEFSK